MKWPEHMDSTDKTLALLALATAVLLISALVAQIPPPSDANSLGPPDRNIENENCFCHSNDETGKEADDAMRIIIDPASPDKMVTGGNATIMVTMNYLGANKDTRYGFSVDLDSVEGKSLTGSALGAPRATPSENKTHLAHSQPLRDNVINITLTAPNKAQTLLFTFVGNAVNDDGTERGDHWNHMSKEIEIHKKRMVNINASVRNTGDIEASDVNVTFLVDGELIGIENILKVPAGGTENVTHKWDATFYDAGTYKVEILVDANHTNLELNEGNNRIVKKVVLKPLGGEEEEPYDWQTILYYVLGALIVVIILIILYRRLT